MGRLVTPLKIQSGLSQAQRTSNLTATDRMIVWAEGGARASWIRPSLIIQSASGLLSTHSGVIDATNDRVLVYDQSAGLLKWALPADAVANGTITNAKISATAGIVPQYLATFYGTDDDSTDTTITSTTTGTLAYTFTFSLPRTGDYLYFATIGGYISHSAQVYWEAQVQGPGSHTSIWHFVAGTDPSSGTKNGIGSATICGKVTASSGSNSFYLYGKKNLAIGTAVSSRGSIVVLEVG